MPPDLILATVTTWLALVLILPKRSWSQIPRRLRLLAAGERRSVFGPAAPVLGHQAGFGRLLRWGRVNALPVVECGVPVFLLGLALGAYGRQRRRERELLWAETEAGLAWRMLDGQFDREDLSGRFVAGGRPPLRMTTIAEIGATFERPPVAWTQEWEAERLALTVESQEDEPQTVPFRPSLDGRLRIHTLGGLSILFGDEDLAPALLRRQVLAFLWLLLLSWALDPSPRPSERPLVAEELAPGIGRAQQLERLRGRLRDFGLYLHPALVSAIHADPRIVRFELADCSIDVLELRSLAEEAKGTVPYLPEELLKDSVRMLEESSGEFLPEWEALERAVPEGRGAALEMIERIRNDVERARIELLVAVAEAFMARKLPARAVTYLEEVNSRRPDLEPVARRFVEALRQSGQPLRADQVSATYGFPA
ncbi:MAG: hypothetical protein ACR2MY_13690 [Candidatus Dormibacteria bacterium]